MSAKKKILLSLTTVFAVVAIVAISVLGTVAYMTASSKVSNTFTIGDIDLILDEGALGADGFTIDHTLPRVQNNVYHLMPGQTYQKDPTITLSATSEPSYLFVVSKNQITALEDTSELTMRQQMLKNGWALFRETSVGTRVWVYIGQDATNLVDTDAENPYYLDWNLAKAVAVCGSGRVNQQMVDAGQLKYNTDNKFKIFETFHITSKVDDATLKLYVSAEITLSAVAIQCTGVSTAAIGSYQAIEDAWHAAVDQIPTLTDDFGVTTTPVVPQQ